MTAYLYPELTVRDRVFRWGERTYVMGIVNVSPESFSGDGLGDVEAAAAQARRFEAEGADSISTGAGNDRVDCGPGVDAADSDVGNDQNVSGACETFV